MRYCTLYFVMAVSLIAVRTLPLRAQETAPLQDYQQNKFYETGQYSEEDISRIRLADEQYKSEQYSEAMNLYKDAAAGNPGTEELHYNLGNSLFRLGKLQEAVAEYTQALKNNPDDYDSKFNLEFTQNQLKDQQKQQQKQQQNDKQQQDEQEKDKDQEQDQQPDEQDQEQQDNKDQEQDQQPDEQEQDREQDQEQQQQDDREMTQEEAERILNALLNDEQDLQEQRKMPSQGNVKVLIDW